nr:SUMF1/EgtB/PvdO family nonheme iron enzyme [Treponema sp.]
MRRFFGVFALTLCAALTMSFASCSSGSSDSEENPGTTTIITGNPADSSGSSDSEEKTGISDVTTESPAESPENADVTTESPETSGETPTVATYTVTFDSDGGSEVASQTVESGKTATKPTDPKKSGEKTSYAFLGWYNGDSAFDFASEIKGEITLKAKWLEGFVKVTGTTIKGDETWTPTSKVFVSGRSLTIPDLIVCDHEVTRGEFKEVMGEDPSIASAYDKDGNKLTGDNVLNNPVNYVNWYAAIAYCNKLSIKEGLDCAYTVSGITDWENLAYSSIPTSSNDTWNAATCDFEANGYRLPTEAEWEWLARGGENYTYAGSNTVGDVAWYTSNTNDTGSRDVKTKAANGYGLYDMSGNVREWCWDWYGSISSSTDATGSASGSGRVRRGGSWGSDAYYCAVSRRNYGSPDYRDDYLGFRVVRNAE